MPGRIEAHALDHGARRIRDGIDRAQVVPVHVLNAGRRRRLVRGREHGKIADVDLGVRNAARAEHHLHCVTSSRRNR
jgi:hypothetical protein